MPRIIDYPKVLSQLTTDGLQSNYHNSGAFGFPSAPKIRGWIESHDPTIKPHMLQNTRILSPENQSTLATQIWLNHLPGPAWLMPASHWSFELNFGSPSWLPQLLQEIGIDPKSLMQLTNAAALEFAPAEQPEFETTLLRLLQNLTVSDFSLAFPTRKTICTIHHHRQLWWTTLDLNLIAALDALATTP